MDEKSRNNLSFKENASSSLVKTIVYLSSAFLLLLVIGYGLSCGYISARHNETVSTEIITIDKDTYVQKEYFLDENYTGCTSTRFYLNSRGSQKILFSCSGYSLVTYKWEKSKLHLEVEELRDVKEGYLFVHDKSKCRVIILGYGSDCGQVHF